MKDRNNKAEILRGLSMLTQLGMSIAVPPILCIFFGLWLQRKFSLGDWLIPVCLVVGLISSGCSFASFLRTARYKVKKEEQNRETRQDR